MLTVIIVSFVVIAAAATVCMLGCYIVTICSENISASYSYSR